MEHHKGPGFNLQIGGGIFLCGVCILPQSKSTHTIGCLVTENVSVCVCSAAVCKMNEQTWTVAEKASSGTGHHDVICILWILQDIKDVNNI